jgi:uncharacterized membrane protein YhaH (DUF805 family)
MDWNFLFLSANGRIGQKDFWVGFLILFVASIICSLIPILGMILILALIYPWVCLYTKRLHDFGKSGWLQLIPIAANFLLGIVATVVSGGAMMAASAGSAGGLGAMFATMGLFLLISLAIGIGFLLWVGLSKGDPGSNQYGPPPASTTAAAV